MEALSSPEAIKKAFLSSNAPVTVSEDIGSVYEAT